MKNTLLVIGLLAVSIPCQAVRPAGTPPATMNTAPAKAADAQFAKAARDDSSGLRKGTIEAVSLAGGTFHVHGQQLTFNAKQVRVYGRDGKAGSIYALRPGGNIRFTLDPTDPLRRRVALIYVD